MNELPEHVQFKILDFLPTLDAIRCRAVCKLWLALLDQFVLDELNVFFEERQCTKYFELANCFSQPNKSISSQTFERIMVKKVDYLLGNLRKFSFGHDAINQVINYFDLQKVTRSMKNLEHLYLVGLPLFSIELHKLRTFNCSFSCETRGYTSICRKVLDCPELESLAIDREAIEALVLNCPKLRYLKYVRYSWIGKLDNLEVLNLEELKTTSEQMLGNHPKLHTLNVHTVKKPELNEIVRRARELRRVHLKIFVKSLPVDAELLEAFDEIFGENFGKNHYTAKAVEFYARHEPAFREDFFIFDNLHSIYITSETFANLKLMIERTSIFRKIRREQRLCFSELDLDFSQNELVELVKKLPNVSVLKLSNTTDKYPFCNPFCMQLIDILKSRKCICKSLDNYNFNDNTKDLTYVFSK